MSNMYDSDHVDPVKKRLVASIIKMDSPELKVDLKKRYPSRMGRQPVSKEQLEETKAMLEKLKLECEEVTHHLKEHTDKNRDRIGVVSKEYGLAKSRLTRFIQRHDTGEQEECTGDTKSDCKRKRDDDWSPGYCTNDGDDDNGDDESGKLRRLVEMLEQLKTIVGDLESENMKLRCQVSRLKEENDERMESDSELSDADPNTAGPVVYDPADSSHNSCQGATGDGVGSVDDANYGYLIMEYIQGAGESGPNDK